tara:strand:- start:495 stop:1025 length:531 start_codon:yes stop_codon:yes gene_type:complete
MAFKLNGKTLAVGTAFTANGINYPANWLSLTSLDEKKAIGITEEADPTVYDPKWYKTTGAEKSITDYNIKDGSGNDVKDANGDVIVAKGLKNTFIEEDKIQAKGLLEKTDWYVIRKAELGTAIPSAITTKRNAIKTACATREAEINACDTHAKLVTLYGQDSDGKPNMTQWPSEDK